MSSSDEDVPLFQRNPAFMLGKQKPIVLSSDEDSPLPSWLDNHDAAADKSLPAMRDSSSDSDIKEVMSPVKLLSPSKKQKLDHSDQDHVLETQRTQTDPLQPESSTRVIKKESPLLSKKQQTPKSANKNAALTSALPPSSQQQSSQQQKPLIPVSSSTVPITVPDKLSQLKMLVELETTDEIHGATDLSGDSGAIGRFIINPTNKQLQIDLKGVLYNASIVPTPVTMAVVNIGQVGAKIECVFNEFIQLREDARFSQAMGSASALFGGLLGGDEDDDGYDDDDNEEGGGKEGKEGEDKKSNKKKKATATTTTRGGKSGAIGKRGGRGGGGVKKAAAPRKRKTSGGGKSKGKSKKK